MNRLWVRLSLMISAVLFFVFFLQFLEIMLPDKDQPIPTQTRDMGPGNASKQEIASRLIDFMILSVGVGLAGGAIIGRVVSAPITQLADAALRIGKGEQNVRVPPHGSREIVQLAEAFNKMSADLQHAETLRKNLMADVSHELRTPLTVLEGNLRAVLDHVYVLDEAEIANLYGQTRHLIRVVNDLRELSLAESGQLPLEMVPTDLQKLIAETLQTLEPLSLEKEVKLTARITELPEMMVDPIRIRQVLFNLLSNALRHTPPGGEIILTSTYKENEVSLSIQDSGEGLDADQLAAVFDRFYRGDKSRSRDTGGTGLGLAIVKAIVESHHGQVKAFSAGKGNGCTFVVTLPLGKEKQEER